MVSMFPSRMVFGRLFVVFGRLLVTLVFRDLRGEK